MLYDLFFQGRSEGHVYGVEARAELVERSRELAGRLGFDRMSFLAATVQEAMAHAGLPPQIDVVTALHACDTATDDAIDFGLSRQARFFVLVPCCQAEVAGLLRQKKASALGAGALAELWRHPLHTREFGSQATNVLRTLQLQAHGYQVTVTELVGWEHSLKNELIIESYRNAPRRAPAERLRNLLNMLGLDEMQDRFFVPGEHPAKA